MSRARNRGVILGGGIAALTDAPEGVQKARPLSPSWLEFDYVVEVGEVVYEA
jgi:hypothetical protein